MLNEVEKKKVIIVQPNIMPYRVPFFIKLKEVLDDYHVDFEVLAGAPLKGSESYDERKSVEFCTPVKNIYLKGIASPVWQRGVLRLTKDADLIIGPQQNAYLPCYFWLLNKKQLFAWWGHGKKFQKKGNERFRSLWKNIMAVKSDWWFAYNDLSTAVIQSLGYPVKRITSVQNSTDTASLRKACVKAQGSESTTFEELFSIPFSGQPIGIFCARFNPIKNVPLMLKTIIEIKKNLPGFYMIVIGDGPDRDTVSEFCSAHPWCCWVGPISGDDRAKYFILADLWINPGMIGLQVNDSFGAGVPLITMASDLHSPEVSYIESGVNGMIVSGGIESFSDSVVKTLKDKPFLTHLKSGTVNSSSTFSIENMVNNFSSGILGALDLMQS